MPRVDLAKIRKLREANGITQAQMAQHLNYKSSIGYHYLEKGRCQINADQLAVIAQLLGEPIEALYEDCDHQHPRQRAG